MWVRVATFEGGDTEKLDKLMDERMSSGEMAPPEGMSSVLVLDDKDATAATRSRLRRPHSISKVTRSRRRSAASVRASTTTTS
jgi:hypothetical protein